MNETREEFMADEEVAVLETIRKAYRIVLYATALGIPISLITLGLFGSSVLPDLIASFDTSDLESLFVSGILAIIILGSLIGTPLLFRRLSDRVNQDLQERIKVITTHEIIKKKIESDGDREIVLENYEDHDVSAETYDRLEVGMKITISRAKYSKTILGAKRADTGEVVTFVRS